MFRKLCRVLTSELTWPSRARYLGLVLLQRLGWQGDGKLYYRIKGGTRVRLRAASTDFKVFEEIFIERVYARFAALLPKGGTILDLGANIGLSAIFLGRAAPEAAVIAVEPEPGNFAVLLENLGRAGLAHRARTVWAFAGAEAGFAAVEDSGNGAWGFRIGPQSFGSRPADRVPVIPISELIVGAAGPVTIKCDIEGAERELFRRLEDWEDLASLMILELHTEHLPAKELFEILGRSRYEWTIHGEIVETACIGHIALERNTRKRARQAQRSLH